MIFSEWLQRKGHENDTKEPWRTLNDGVRPVWLQMVGILAYFGGCAAAW
eukprot:CAMPEP_0183323090 /NCGR_PEP_ID=MMETSP0160_2-20130417/73528_1 /TAXON_ID=2839 ORGANISM="Odontella Sinensis, Strain Grunow 1884" /NCGR_SAMPLE_ID=MMETSP0160_2 /ASSEMBLY_ACC=CAM_ASM_000250 /LENGTH=48 /DNA_ID= /DNA_START= /DNA_END= /DNA_ORIENTATION=